MDNSGCNYCGQYFLLLFFLFTTSTLSADVVKPALVEITANTSGTITIEVRASIEALLTGINSKYKNTRDAPNADAYDVLRKLAADDLELKFTQFETKFLDTIELQADGERVPLTLLDVDIPEPGYTKVPRISLIRLHSALSRSTENLVWYYPQSFGDNAARVRQVDNQNEEWHWSAWQWLRNDKSSAPFSLEALFLRRPIYEVVGSYLVLGFEHIAPKGLDHILFILGLFLLSKHLKPLLWQITMFTFAHTITLGLSMHGVIELSSRIVEPLIALSIAYVGIENVLSRKLHRSRLVLVFFFGLLHGLGFAGVLSDFGMPKDAFATALISFNAGVELGQLVVVMLAWAGLTVWFKSAENYRKFVVIPFSLAISIMGLYWTYDRLEFGIF